MPLSKFIRYTCVYVFFHVNYFFISEYNMRLHTQSAWMFLDQRHFANTGINQWERSG